MGRSSKQVVPLKSKLKKDRGVPRLPEVRPRNANKQNSRSTRHAVSEAGGQTISSLAEVSVQSSSWIPDDESSPPSPETKTKEQVRRHYVRTLHKVIDESDIIILVLDARDPEGCRSRLVEEEVRRRESEGKKLVFVLNKIDLVPRANAEQWLRYLRHSAPTLPFRSAPSTRRSNLSSPTAPSLLRLLKAYKPSAQSVTVGVVGFPNVGKSSLINSLKRAKVCAVAAQPGHTKDVQSIQLERGIKIIDSPGVVFDDDMTPGLEGGPTKGSILLRNVVKVEDVDDVMLVVEEIIARTEAETLRQIYNLPTIGPCVEFLTMLALSSGRLRKGGGPDILAAARTVLTDWNHQKIPYFSIPPEVHVSSIPSAVPAPGAENVGQAQILTELGKPFELEGLFGAADSRAFENVDKGHDMEQAARAVGQPDPPEAMEEDSWHTLMRRSPPEAEETSQPYRSKRSRSLSSTRCVPPGSPPYCSADMSDDDSPRPSKRFRRSKEVPATHEDMAQHNPMSRRVLRKEAKRARRAAKSRGDGCGDGMDVDDGLEFTFMA